jgi:hypothetical protein
MPPDRQLPPGAYARSGARGIGKTGRPPMRLRWDNSAQDRHWDQHQAGTAVNQYAPPRLVQISGQLRGVSVSRVSVVRDVAGAEGHLVREGVTVE